MHKILQKKRQFSQNYILLWTKKVNRIPLFSEFLRKKSLLSCPYFVKKQTALMSILCQKTIHSVKNMVLSCNFCKAFHKKPILSCPYLVIKRQFCENYTILTAKNVNKMPFFSDLKKNAYCHAHIYKHSALKPIFCQKNVHSLKKLYSHIILSQFSMKYSLPLSPYLVKKRKCCQNCSIFCARSIGCPSFPIFHG